MTTQYAVVAVAAAFVGAAAALSIGSAFAILPGIPALDEPGERDPRHGDHGENRTGHAHDHDRKAKDGRHAEGHDAHEGHEGHRKDHGDHAKGHETHEEHCAGSSGGKAPEETASEGP